MASAADRRLGFLAISGIAEDWKFGLALVIGFACLTAVQAAIRRL
ncbi:hypothetical protein [Kribbella jejuensis]|nr:hypothetical protein [Kribbella jejuensis]